MNHVSPFLQAQLAPAEHNVYGRSLRALSLWHSYLLRQLGNKLWTSDEATSDDMASMILVCERTRVTCRELFLNEHRLADAMKAISKWLSRQDTSFLASELRAYIASYTTFPNKWTKEKDSGRRTIRAPFEWHIVRGLCKSYGYHHDEAWDLPYNLAVSLWMVDQEAEGDDSLMTEKEIAAIHVQGGSVEGDVA